MRVNVNRGQIPSEIGWLADWMDDTERRIKTLETSGTANAQVAATIQRVLAMQEREYAEFTTAKTGTAGFYTSPCSVAITSATGRIEVGYGGTLNNGDGYFVYSITRTDTGAVVVNRATVQANAAQRVAVSGGASFAPSGYRVMPVDVPADVPLLVALEIHGGGSSSTWFFGGSISARVVA